MVSVTDQSNQICSETERNQDGGNSQQVLFIHPKTKRSNFSHYIQILHTVLVHLLHHLYTRKIYIKM